MGTVTVSAMERPPLVLGMNTGLSEGPLFLQRGGLLTVAVDRGQILRTTDEGQTIFAVTGNGPNGLAEGADGSVYVAMSGRAGRQPAGGTKGGILAVRPNGDQSWITCEPVAPNDLCFGPDGLLYFTDPARGRRDDGRIWRVNVETREAQLLVSVGWYPNGIGFGLEDHAVYVADTTGGRIMRYPIIRGGLGSVELAVQMAYGVPDGFAFDVDGNIIVAAQKDLFAAPGGPAAALGDDIQTYAPSGRLTDAYRPQISQHYTNVALTSARRLVITAAGDTSAIASGRETGGAILAVDDWPAVGLALHPFRALSPCRRSSAVTSPRRGANR